MEVDRQEDGNLVNHRVQGIEGGFFFKKKIQLVSTEKAKGKNYFQLRINSMFSQTVNQLWRQNKDIYKHAKLIKTTSQMSFLKIPLVIKCSKTKK